MTRGSFVSLWTFPPGGFIVWCSHVSVPAMPHHLLSWESPIIWVDLDRGPYLKAVLLLAGILAGPAPLQAQAENGWIGKRVITQYGTVLQVGNQVVDDEERGKNLARGVDFGLLVMILIRFPSLDAERKALGRLTSRFSFKSRATGRCWYRKRPCRIWRSKASVLPSRDRRPMSSFLRRHEIILPPRFNEDGQGYFFLNETTRG